MQAQPKPVSGAVFGGLFGVVLVVLLWQLGVVPPDRLILFGVVAIMTMVGTMVLTQRVALGRKRFVALIVVSSLLGGVALTGIPEFIRGGAISDGCTVQANSSLSQVTGPSATSATSPFSATPTDSVTWSAASDTQLTTGTNSVGLRIGGLDAELSHGTTTNSVGVRQLEGVQSVQALQDAVRDSLGVTVTGVYHVYGYIHTDEGECLADAYVVVKPSSAFGTPLLIGLWALAALVLVVILGLAIGVRRSIRSAQRQQATMPSVLALPTETSTGSPMVGISAPTEASATTPPHTDDAVRESPDEGPAAGEPSSDDEAGAGRPGDPLD